MKSFSRYFLICCTVFSISLTACKNSQSDQQSNPQSKELRGNISISGAFALYPLTVGWAEEFKKLHPDVTIDISAGGAGKGMVDVLAGMVDIAMFSREVSSEEEDKGAWKVAVAKDAVFPTINAQNPVLKEIKTKGLTQNQLTNLYTSTSPQFWQNFEGITSTGKINVYTRSDACGAAAMWANYLGNAQEDLTGIGVFGDPGIADAVKKDKLGVGFNNLIYIFDIKTELVNEGLEIIPLDFNENRIIDPEEAFYGTMKSVRQAISEGRYPSPPARNLYLILKGKPKNKLAEAFLEYILTDGQKLIPKAGYVELEEKVLQHQKVILGI